MKNKTLSERARVTYKNLNVNGLNIFYREAGLPTLPTIILLHGFPSSSRMFQTLIPLLADQYHIVAPDYPGFGYSDAPSPEKFQYTFENLASKLEEFIEQLNISQFSLYMQDYGGPIGFRIAQKSPKKIYSIIIQNAVAHEQGLSPVWNTLRAFWRDHKTNEQLIVSNLKSIDAARNRHIGGLPSSEHINPDTWVDEYNYIMRPGQLKILMDLYYDYRTNVAAYPLWQEWLRNNKPPLLVVWGKYDPLFTVEGAFAYKNDVPEAQIHILDAGHFALDEENIYIAKIILSFLSFIH